MQRFASNRMEILAANLAAHLMVEPGDPMEPEIVVVQSRGMERWLSMELARWSGVCANMTFLFPGSLMERCLMPAAVHGDSSPWEKASLRWVLYRILQKLPEDEVFQPLDRYMQKDSLRTLQLAGLVSDLFDEYILFRPQRVLSWEKGVENHFQARLWRLLKNEINAPHKINLLQSFDPGKEEGLSSFIPKRISIFGVSALPPLYLSFFKKLGEMVKIRWYLLDPCREYWGDISVQKADIFQESFQIPAPVEESSLEEKAHPLLSSLGKTGRDFFGGLAAMPGSEERFFAEPGRDSLLHRIQSGIGTLDSAQWKALQNEPFSQADDSIRIHTCHGPMREMEVLRDELLQLFSQENPPSPREILVMFPDIAAYAPYVEAVFGEALPDGGRLPFRIADRNLLAENRIAALLLEILALLSSRFTASEVFDILEYPLIAKKFGLSGPDLEEIRSWILDLGISWGLDGTFKELQNLPGLKGGTWKAGLDRMALGLAMEDAGIVGEDFLPYDPMGPEKARVLAGFLDFMEKLIALYEESRIPRPMRGWTELLRKFLDDFFEENPETAEDFISVRKILESLWEEAEAGGMEEEALSFSVLRHTFGEILFSGKSLSAFPGGGITFCAMVPMRCIPFPHICLCGMNGESFPRKDFRPAFDLIKSHPEPGDRSRRDDDRYLFLETLLSARKKIWITYTGFSTGDNTILPPSVLVEELIHASGLLREKLIRNHPMQPFSPGLFMKGEKNNPESFSRKNLALAQAIRRQTRESFVFQNAANDLAEKETREIFLSDLISFFSDPSKFFLKQELGIRLKGDEELLSDEELFSLKSLDRYSLRQGFCEIALEGENDAPFWKRLELENRIPQGERGKIPVHELALQGKALARKILELGAPISPQMKRAHLDFGSIILEGEIPDSEKGSELFWRGGKIRPKDEMSAWIHFLFRKALGLETSLFFAGTDEKDSSQLRVLSFEGNPDAGAILQDLLSIFLEGKKRPLPLFPDFSRELVEKRHFPKKKGSGDVDMEKMQEGWEKGRAGEAARILWQGKDPFAPPFEELAERVWLPILEAGKESPRSKV